MDSAGSFVGLAPRAESRNVGVLPRGLPGVTFAAFVTLLEANGFCLHRQGKGSHVIYRGVVDGEVMLVTVAAHRASDAIKPGTLAAMIRQSGLPKKLFR